MLTACPGAANEGEGAVTLISVVPTWRQARSFCRWALKGAGGPWRCTGGISLHLSVQSVMEWGTQGAVGGAPHSRRLLARGGAQSCTWHGGIVTMVTAMAGVFRVVSSMFHHLVPRELQSNAKRIDSGKFARPLGPVPSQWREGRTRGTPLYDAFKFYMYRQTHLDWLAQNLTLKSMNP